MERPEIKTQTREQNTLLFGTGNAAKLGAMRRRLSGLGLEILGLMDMDRKPPAVPETGSTPLENAQQKALVYYDFYRIPVFSCDSGLYFEDLPEALQPGAHVRTVGGKLLTDEEMLAYYGGLAKRHGGIRARYRHAVCLVMDREHVHAIMDDSTASEIFLLTDSPCQSVQHRGFPLDSLSVSLRTGEYFYDLNQDQTDRLAVGDGVLDFFQKYLQDKCTC